MQILVAGKCVKEIAAELALSLKAVSTFRSRLLGRRAYFNILLMTSLA
jgi:DNA-binding NarL/FixJ family response regulator